MSSTFKAVFLGINWVKNDLLTSIQQEKITTSPTEGIFPIFEKNCMINGKNSKVEFISTDNDDTKDMIKKIKTGKLIIITHFLAHRKQFQPMLYKYRDLISKNEKKSVLVCGLKNNRNLNFLTKEDIKKKDQRLHFEYIEVDLTDYNTIKMFINKLVDMIGLPDEVGHPRQNGIKYICYSDRTCIAIENDSSSGDDFYIPTKISYKFKEYTVKGIGYYYHQDYGENSFYRTKKIIMEKDSKVTYIGDIHAEKLDILVISESVENISRFFPLSKASSGYTIN